MKIKKTAAAAALILLLSGCSGGKPAETDSAAPVTSESVTTASSVSGTPAPLEKYVVTCDELAQRVLDSVADHVPVMKVTDEVMISDILGYDLTLTEDSSMYVQLVSANLFELTVMRPAEGQEDAVNEMLEARRTYLMEQAAFYPDQVKAADATIVASVDGYSYLICDADAVEYEKQLIRLIKTL